MQALAEYKMFWGLKLYTEYISQNNTLAQEKTGLYFKMWSIINNYKKKKKGYFAIALDFLFMKLLAVQKKKKIIKSHRDFQPGSGSSFAQQHHWQEQKKPPLAMASPGSLVGCIQPGNTPSASYSGNKYNGQILLSGHISWCLRLDISACPQSVCPAAPQDGYYRSRSATWAS